MGGFLMDLGFQESAEMARVLVTYIDCPRRVRHAILGEFNSAPSITTIENMRKAHLAPQADPEPIRHNDGYYPGDAVDELEQINAAFLRRLDAERRTSAKLRQMIARCPTLAERFERAA